MARKKVIKKEERHCCGECGNAYDFHSPALDGTPTLCRCQYYTEGKFCRIVSERACEHFKIRMP